MERDGEVVGLRYSTNGRTCATHECCGTSVEVGNLVHFHVAIVEVEGQPQEAIKAITLRLEGEVYHERCVIGFLPRNIVIGMRDKFVNKTGQIVELYQKLPRREQAPAEAAGTS